MLRLLLVFGAATPYALAALFCAAIFAVIALDVAIGVVGSLELPWDGGPAPPGPAPSPSPGTAAPTGPAPAPEGCVTMPGGLIVCE